MRARMLSDREGGVREGGAFLPTSWSRRARWLCAAGGMTWSPMSVRRSTGRGLLSSFMRVLFGIVSQPAALRWEGVTAHEIFEDLAAAMPQKDQGHGHRWGRADVIASLRAAGSYFAAGNVFWGGNPIHNITATAELLCWGEAATLVLVKLCVCVCVCVCACVCVSESASTHSFSAYA